MAVFFITSVINVIRRRTVDMSHFLDLKTVKCVCCAQKLY